MVRKIIEIPTIVDSVIYMPMPQGDGTDQLDRNDIQVPRSKKRQE